jgi:hypothetical protein
MILTAWMFVKPLRGVKFSCTAPRATLVVMPKTPSITRALVRLAICVAALAVPSAAFADCSHEIIDQAYKGKITKHYSQACYSAAIRIEPVDGSSYSDIDSIIRDAKRADALRDRDAAVVSTPTGNGNAPRTQSGNSRASTATSSSPAVTPPGTADVGGGRTPAQPSALASTQPKPETTELGAPSATPVLDRLAPAHAGDLPVAVIVLGVLAGLLVLAGIAGAILRRRATRASS